MRLLPKAAPTVPTATQLQVQVQVLTLSLALALLTGCASPDVNPNQAKIGRGYVDLYTQPKGDVWWKIDVFDAHDLSYKEFTAQFEAPTQGIFRLEARPGRYKARITILNQAVEAPAEVEVEIRAGMIAPIQVTLEQSREAFVRKVDDRAGPSARNKVKDLPQEILRISASAQPFVPYVPKEQSSYWK